MGKLKSALAVFVFFIMMTQPARAMLLEYDGEVHEYDGGVFSLIVNNEVLNPPLAPIIFNDRALVPVREIFEELGAEVSYNVDTQTVGVEKDNTYISMRINDNIAYINGEPTMILDSVVPKLISEFGGETKTMVPVRFISENIGLDVDFNQEHRAILVESAGYSFEQPKEPEYTRITDVSYSVKNSKTVVITAKSETPIEDYSSFELSSPGRLVIDFPHGSMNCREERININEAGISAVRLGDNAERARIVVDTEYLLSYDVEQDSEYELTITLKTSGVATPTPTPTPKPVVQPTASPKTSGAPKTTMTPISRTPKPASKPTVKPYSNDVKLIVLDAGHGGTDGGASGMLDGKVVLEKNLTLEITNKVKEILKGKGYTVSMTRTGDTLPTLAERADQANAENAAVFVSIHINSVENAPNASGTEVYYAASNNDDDYGVDSETLANNILKRMLYYMNSVNRGVKTAEHAVTRRSNMPAALVEVGFITNAEEIYNMTSEDYQYKAAEGIAEGIIITLRDITIPE